MQGIQRKCSHCKESFYITKDSINNAIYYDKKTYHSKCFVEMCNQKGNSKRSDVAKKWVDVLNNLEEIKIQSYLFYDCVITKEDIFKFIQDSYGVVVVPTNVWHKLSSIYNGTFKGMSVGIPPKHLLDMWKRKKCELDKIAGRNKAVGKRMTTEQRISYDLSILINKYDSYLKWIERQKIIDAENRENEKNTIITSFVSNAEKIVEDDDSDISNLVDDIFGED